MALIPYHNDGKSTVHVGTKSIPPGETREVDETLLNRPRKPVDFNDLDADLTEATGLGALLEKSVKDITAELDSLNDEQLAELEQLEKDGKKRSSLVSAIQQTMMTRAANQLNGEDGDESSDADQPAGDDEAQTDGEKPANKEAGGDE
ncbi:hypothetical protein FAZ79_00520 [Guyparkeria sp. SB14A]|uniref:hypothetical protein n=1 Tax=Guyparkeria sp. SB14A TaxID=2571147 RepID=UPI0010AC752D|nr:hypothetical protein [Guyparkeria sp. SB14A]TKA91823.1 hypothetical protein FAZ79_00520 [Guyparkeria sp. SB14A]